MGYEVVNFPTRTLLTHQDLGQLSDNDEFLKVGWSDYKRPKVVFINSTTVSVEENTGVADESKIVFRFGDIRFANAALRNCDLSIASDHTSIIPIGGLHSSYTLTANRWYHIYAVGTTAIGQENNFIVAADEAAPNVGVDVVSLNNHFGFNNYYYLGAIRNGDSLSSPNGILDFIMAGGLTMFKNTIVGNSGRGAVGIQLATKTGGGTLTYTHAVGVGDLQMPSTIDGALYMPSFENGINQVNVRDSAAAIGFERTNGGYQKILDLPAAFGLHAEMIGLDGIDIFLAGFRDGFFQSDHNKDLY